MKRFPLFLLIVCLFVTPVCWADSPYGIKKQTFPTPRGYVSDFAELFDQEWKSRIRGVCKELETRTGVELIVVTIPTVKPYPHARNYAEALYEEWRIGTAQKEQGILLLTSLNERQAVVVLGKTLIPVIGKPQLDILSEQHLIPMFQSSNYGEAIFQTVVGLSAASGKVTKDPVKKKKSSAGFWMNVAVVVAMLFALWRFTRPERRHPFQRWRRGEYWGTGQGGFGGGFGGFGGGTSGQGLS
ncbi:TPM domain-containing protein [Candidatus Nitronereus thalassa]|uniref:TPM domain-containing protein n=1 Tax=Candidatus Nitronereus thalassa TaxID=3020898 RepID=A0ABU3K438_9BACT|nr:TPM domain-containing protein [Candidatus Nitronereus thalassa]MDT7041161.1 TPM domain-containing protein [Candidatus Nitronereus thalassa]